MGQGHFTQAYKLQCIVLRLSLKEIEGSISPLPGRNTYIYPKKATTNLEHFQFHQSEKTLITKITLFPFIFMCCQPVVYVTHLYIIQWYRNESQTRKLVSIFAFQVALSQSQWAFESVYA